MAEVAGAAEGLKLFEAGASKAGAAGGESAAAGGKAEAHGGLGGLGGLGGGGEHGEHGEHGGLGGLGGGGGGGKFGKMASMMSGGIPCEYQLPMEFFVLFLFTFLIYFLVFGFVPYRNIVSTMTHYIIGFPEKVYNKFLGHVPSSIKNAKSGSVFSQANKFIHVTIPNMIQKEKTKLLTPLQKKLQKLKEKENKQLNDSNSGGANKLKTSVSKVKVKVLSAWETLKHKIIPAIFISIIYYVIWLIIFKIIPQVLKYGINMAMSFKK